MTDITARPDLGACLEFLAEAIAMLDNGNGIADDARYSFVERAGAFYRSQFAATRPDALAGKLAEALPAMRGAFRTTTGGPGGFVMTFRFPTMEAMHKADDEWREVTGHA